MNRDLLTGIIRTASRACLLLVVPAAALVVSMGASPGPGARENEPYLDLRARPMAAFAPARIVFTGVLRDVAGDNEDVYCPTVAWDWGDGTTSTATSSCAPFDPGESEIQRYFVKSHIYRVPGQYTIVLRLWKHRRLVVYGNADVNISRAP